MAIAAGPAEVSRHKCLIYDGHPSEQLGVIAPLLIDGLKTNRRCLYLGDPEMVTMVHGALLKRGVDVRHELDRGALVLSSDRSHLREGFDPAAMVEMLVGMIEQAVGDGFDGLCATGDMRWELGEDRNFDRLLEYEARLERLCRDQPLQGICQYHRSTVPATALRDAMLAHRSLYLGDTLNDDNLFYMPPELLLDGDGARGQQGEWMCHQLARIARAERKRDQALTALRASEAEQRDLAERLAQTNQALELRVQERTAEIEAANRELEEFSYSVSHDLRTPLRSLDQVSRELIESRERASTPAERGMLERIRASVRQMSALIETMLALTRLARAEKVPEVVDLSALARELADGLRREDAAREVEFVIAPGLRALGYPKMLRMALDNLLRNAWKFSSKRARARIEVGSRGREGDQGVFFVADDGVGFDMRNAFRLFRVFNRLHPEQEFPGVGIGLAAVQRIVRRHGGRIRADGEPGRGASFLFTLPSVGEG